MVRRRKTYPRPDAAKCRPSGERHAFYALIPGGERFDPAKPNFTILECFLTRAGRACTSGIPSYTPPTCCALPRRRGFSVCIRWAGTPFGLPAEHSDQKRPASAVTRARTWRNSREITRIGFSRLAAGDHTTDRLLQWRRSDFFYRFTIPGLSETKRPSRFHLSRTVRIASALMS